MPWHKFNWHPDGIKVDCPDKRTAKFVTAIATTRNESGIIASCNRRWMNMSVICSMFWIIWSPSKNRNLLEITNYRINKQIQSRVKTTKHRTPPPYPPRPPIIYSSPFIHPPKNALKLTTSSRPPRSPRPCVLSLEANLTHPFSQNGYATSNDWWEISGGLPLRSICRIDY